MPGTGATAINKFFKQHHPILSIVKWPVHAISLLELAARDLHPAQVHAEGGEWSAPGQRVEMLVRAKRRRPEPTLQPYRNYVRLSTKKSLSEFASYKAI